MLIVLFNLIFLIFSYGLLYSQHICDASHSSIELVNGYKGIVVALSPQTQLTINDMDNVQVTKYERICFSTGVCYLYFTIPYYTIL